MAPIKHGHARRGRPSPEYRAWWEMVRRCEDPTRQNYDRYGGRGISVCSDWRSDGGFERFLADVGLRPSPLHSIDRIDVNGNYEPANVRWATRSEQARNKRNSVHITACGATMTLGEWARRANLSPETILYRLRHGMSPDDAVTKPSRNKNMAARRLAQQESRV